MKQLYLLITLIVFGYSASAQITVIPDPAFEERLIDLNIDSDGLVNGQVLTSDVENITELNIEIGMDITDLTGMEAFSNLQELTVIHTMITSLDVSENTQLRVLNCRSNSLTAIDVSSNALLEELFIGNTSDVGPFNEITEIDLSNNPNIKFIDANLVHSGVERINLRNGNNNEDMTIDVSVWTGETAPDPNLVLNTTCIEIDDEELAQNNQFPYSEWVIYDIQAAHIFSENCALGTQSFESNNSISIYPNPTSDMLYFSTTNGTAVEKATLYDISGRVVKEFSTVSNSQISVAGLTKGVYVIQMVSGSASQTAKVVVE
jgi:hypothetical protein